MLLPSFLSRLFSEVRIFADGADSANLPPLIICRYRRQSDPQTLQRALNCRLIIAGNAPQSPPTADNQENIIYSGDLSAEQIRELVRQLRGNPTIRWGFFVEDSATHNGGLGKFHREAILLAAKIGNGVFAPAHIEVAQNKEWQKFGRQQFVVHIGQSQHLEDKNDNKTHARCIADALQSLVAKPTNKNITLAYGQWAQKYSWSHPLFTEFRQPMRTYRQIYRAAWALGEVIAHQQSTSPNNIGVLLPSSIGAAVVFYAAIMRKITPVMLNPGTGVRNILSACQTASVKTVYTSQKLLDNLPAAAESCIALQKSGIEVICLEDVREKVTIAIKLQAALWALFPNFSLRRLPGASATQDDIATILFTSGSESHPKGVALSHGNLLANASQTLARLDNLAHERMLNSLPVFHSFGLLAGVILPAAGGMPTLQYPSPLHYKQIPHIIAHFRPAVFFSADSFLVAYAREAHPLDMQSLRHVFAGAEKLKDTTVQKWLQKFGVRILQGYGVTETSPVIAVNTPADNRLGSVGRILATIESKLTEVEGIDNGGKLWVRGANIMRGYLYADKPNEIIAPPDGWHDTGDIARIDKDGFLYIEGRARRFVKIAGEMAPLDGVENALHEQFAPHHFAAVCVADKTRGEQIVILCDDKNINREQITTAFRDSGLPLLWTPRRIIFAEEIPRLSTGKVDYPAVQRMAEEIAE